MLLANLSNYQQNKLIAQIQSNVAYNGGPSACQVTIEPQPYGNPTELHYTDEDGIETIEIGIKCDGCRTIYSTLEEPGELCSCPKCGRPTNEN